MRLKLVRFRDLKLLNRFCGVGRGRGGVHALDRGIMKGLGKGGREEKEKNKKKKRCREWNGQRKRVFFCFEKFLYSYCIKSLMKIFD